VSWLGYVLNIAVKGRNVMLGCEDFGRRLTA
jgi:hypothetical protein